jgi:uncharacterized surface protein with fasciclin (FAS1) repeats
VYSKSGELASRLLGITVNSSQCYRVCQSVSECIDEDLLNSPSKSLEKIENEVNNMVYGLIDGSMLQMERGWQETKVGRVMKADMVVKNKEPKWQVSQSEYVAHRGYFEEFTSKFEQLLPPDSPCEKVFVTDGAVWIANWLNEKYPKATLILDYFHVSEKIAQIALKLEEDRQRPWYDQQMDSIWLNDVNAVCEAIEKLENVEQKLKINTQEYLKINQYRMNYKDYRAKNLMIGSGHIEAAHRSVLQERMKRSGQHWSENGADNMIKLRVAYRSGKFDIITQTIKNVAA